VIARVAAGAVQRQPVDLARGGYRSTNQSRPSIRVAPSRGGPAEARESWRRQPQRMDLWKSSPSRSPWPR